MMNPLAIGQAVMPGPSAPAAPAAPPPIPTAPPPQAQAQPVPQQDPNAALMSAVQALSSGRHSDANLAEHADLHGKAMGHLSPLVEKGAGLTRDDAVQGVIGAAQNGVLSSQQAAALIDRFHNSPEKLQGAVRGLMAQAMQGAVATAAAQQRQAQAAQPSPQPPAGSP